MLSFIIKLNYTFMENLNKLAQNKYDSKSSKVFIFDLIGNFYVKNKTKFDLKEKILKSASFRLNLSQIFY